MLDAANLNLERDYAPEAGGINPFLHLSLHLAIEEQLSIDQPPGIKGEFERIAGRLGDRHAACHEMLECLGETVWRAQRGHPLNSGANRGDWLYAAALLAFASWRNAVVAAGLSYDALPSMLR